MVVYFNFNIVLCVTVAHKVLILRKYVDTPSVLIVEVWNYEKKEIFMIYPILIRDPVFEPRIQISKVGEHSMVKTKIKEQITYTKWHNYFYFFL